MRNLGSGPRDRGFESRLPDHSHGFTEPAAAESAAANPKSARIDSGQKNDPFKEFERSVRVRVDGGVPGRCSYRSDAR